MTNIIRLGNFISNNIEAILIKWEEISRTINSCNHFIDSNSKRNYAEMMLQTIAHDLTNGEKVLNEEENEKSGAFVNSINTSAEDHAREKLALGFTIEQLFSEYRAIRASVLFLWEQRILEGIVIDQADIRRFNEAVDQTIAASIGHYSMLLKTSQNNFLTKLSHDLRNPLSVIMGSAQIFSLYIDVSDKALSTVARIYNNSLQINDILTNVLDSSIKADGIQLKY